VGVKKFLLKVVI